MKKGNRCQQCGLLKSHQSHVFEHEFVPEERPGFGSQRAPIRAQSDRPGRVQRRQESSDHAREHHERVKHCEASAYGITTPCGTGADSTLEHSHKVGLGMGGGKDYAVSDGECAILCRLHHRAIDTNRAEMRAAGLSKRAPSSQVPRRQTQPGPRIKSMFK